MITEEFALKLAENYLDENLRPHFSARFGIEIVIVGRFARDLPWGWVFLWDSKEFAETYEITRGIVGNGPIAVVKSDGSVHQLGTAGGVDKQIAMFESEVLRIQG